MDERCWRVKVFAARPFSPVIMAESADEAITRALALAAVMHFAPVDRAEAWPLCPPRRHGSDAVRHVPTAGLGQRRVLTGRIGRSHDARPPGRASRDLGGRKHHLRPRGVR